MEAKAAQRKREREEAKFREAQRLREAEQEKKWKDAEQKISRGPATMTKPKSAKEKKKCVLVSCSLNNIISYKDQRLVQLQCEV